MKRFLAALCAAFAFLPWPALATSVLPLFLDELVDRAALVFEGRCIANRVVRDPATDLIVTYTTFEVRDVLKGSAASTHEIKQVGGTLPGEDVELRAHGVPSFVPGEEYVVFLPPASREGFSSPVGLQQGRFAVKSGRRVANGRDFRDMASRILDRLPPVARERLQQAPGPVHDMDLEEFKQTVRNHAAGPR